MTPIRCKELFSGEILTEEQRENKRENQRRYALTPKGIAVRHKYLKSKKGRAVTKKYESSELYRIGKRRRDRTPNYMLLTALKNQRRAA